MVKSLRNLIGTTILAAVSASSQAGTLTVTAPAAGTQANPTLVGLSTNIQFNLAQMKQHQAKVSAVVTFVSNGKPVTTLGPALVNPDPNTDTGSGSLTLSFQPDQTPIEVPLKIVVHAFDVQDPNGVVNPYKDVVLFVLPDVEKPKIFQFNPLNNAFVKGVVKISVQLQEAHLKDWRIQVNSADIPNNTGTTVDAEGTFTVNWDTATSLANSSQTISIRIRDNADNETDQSITVTTDTIPPTVNIQTPANGTTITPGTTITILLAITDATSASVDVTGVDVVVQTTAGKFITRAARMSFKPQGNNGDTWTGRVRWVPGQLPPTFVIVATCVDKAGNKSAVQKVTLHLGS